MCWIGGFTRNLKIDEEKGRGLPTAASDGCREVSEGGVILFKGRQDLYSVGL